jgi:hypothetical protein
MPTWSFCCSCASPPVNFADRSAQHKVSVEVPLLARQRPQTMPSTSKRTAPESPNVTRPRNCRIGESFQIVHWKSEFYKPGKAGLPKGSKPVQVADGPLSDLPSRSSEVRSYPISDIARCIREVG